MATNSNYSKMEFNERKPLKVKDITRNIRKAVVAGSLEEVRLKVAERFNKLDQIPAIHLDSDGTEIDDEEYFQTLEPNTELIAVFPGEHWIDPSDCVIFKTPQDETDAANRAEKAERIKKLISRLQSNLCDISVTSDSDLDSLSDMDPNSLVDLAGSDFMEQLKDTGRPQCARRTAEDRIDLLKLLQEGAIFCSERYPEDAEDIDAEIRKQFDDEIQNDTNIEEEHQPSTSNTKTIEQEQRGDKQQQQMIKIIASDNSLKRQHLQQEWQRQHSQQNDNMAAAAIATTSRGIRAKTPDI